MNGKLSSIIRVLKPAQEPEPDIFTEKQVLFSSFEVVFDVGAHHGRITQKLRQLAPSAKVHSFEPFPSSYAILSERLGQDKRVALNNKAVSDQVGAFPFYSNVGDETNSLLSSVSVDRNIDSQTKSLGVVEVQATTIDEYAIQSNISSIDFIKIDVQGNTLAVLEGAKDMLRSRSINHIYAEVEFVEIYKDEKRFSEIELFLRGFGYELVKFYNLNYTDRGILAWADALFSRSPEW